MTQPEDNWVREEPGLVSEGFNREDYDEAVRKLRVLRFHPNNSGNELVSEIEAMLVHIDRDYSNIGVKEGDVWLCSVELRKSGRSYNAKPLRRITYTSIMSLSEDITKDIIAQLWETKSHGFLTTFAEMYKDQVASETRRAVEAEYEAKIDELNERIRYQNGQLVRSNMIISGMGDQQCDGVELTSEEEPDPMGPRPERTLEAPLGRRDRAPMLMFRRSVHVPGMPEIQRPEFQVDQLSYSVKAERLTDEIIRCDGLRDGNYFVHITPSGKYIVVRPSRYGQVVCSRQCLYLSGLDRFREFQGREELGGEYSPYYEGLIIYLDGMPPEPSSQESSVDDGVRFALLDARSHLRSVWSNRPPGL